MKIRDKIGDIFETEIKDLAFDGKSVGSFGGKIVFLNGGLPGEKVKAEITRTKSKFAIGRVLEIIEPGPGRIKAPCRHFDICGGCTWQDLVYDRQLFYKRKQVLDCLRHIGRIDDIEVGEIVGCPEQFYYRNKMEFSFNTNGKDGFNFGLHRRGRFDRIFDIEECRLQSPRSNSIVAWFRNFITENRIPIYDVEAHTGYIRFLVIRETKNTGRVMLNIVTAAGDFPLADRLIASAAGEFPEIRTIVHNINTKKSNIALGESEEILSGPGYIEEKILGCTFRIYANSFFQTNSRQAERLYSLAFDFLEPNNDDTLLDLYCGTGTIGLCAAGRVRQVIGIELEPSAVRAAEENARLNGIDNAIFHTGSVQTILAEQPELFRSVTAVIVDPPRAGLHPKALKKLIELGPPKIIYISCNPATFARDAAVFREAGYVLSKTVPVDMFPHTMHIELVGGFYKNESKTPEVL
nr:23S rRNA (uracil(1939)-C(5))-methyltransferase RlmD [candidate division Zixibacteria bacterium]